MLSTRHQGRTLLVRLTGRLSGARSGSSAAWRADAADALLRDDDVVEVPYPFSWRAGVPIVLKEDRIDAIILPCANPIQVCTAGLKLIVDPELKDAVRQARGVQLDVGLDAIPSVGGGRREKRGGARFGAKPLQIGEVVVFRGGQVAAAVDSARRVHAQEIAAAPDVGDHCLSPFWIREDRRTRQLVWAPAPSWLHPEIDSPVYFPKVRRRMAL